MSDAERIAIVLALVAATGLFTLAEYALVTTRRWRMQELARTGSRRAAGVLELMTEPLRFIATIQLGISAVSILGAPRVIVGDSGPLTGSGFGV
jgi:putative hemolysin